jgi:hypothetical protein
VTEDGPRDTARCVRPQETVRPLGEAAGTTEGSSVNVWPGFDGSRSWFLYFEAAKRLNGGILTW